MEQSCCSCAGAGPLPAHRRPHRLDADEPIVEAVVAAVGNALAIEVNVAFPALERQRAATLQGRILHVPRRPVERQDCGPLAAVVAGTRLLAPAAPLSR